MMKETAWLKLCLKQLRRENAGLRKMHRSLREGVDLLLRQKDELEAELLHNRLECEKLHAKLIKAGLE